MHYGGSFFVGCVSPSQNYWTSMSAVLHVLPVSICKLFEPDASTWNSNKISFQLNDVSNKVVLQSYIE